MFNFHFLQTVIFEYFFYFWLKTPQNYKSCSKNCKNDQFALLSFIFHFRKIQFSTLTFFLGPLTWNCPLAKIWDHISILFFYIWFWSGAQDPWRSRNMFRVGFNISNIFFLNQKGCLNCLKKANNLKIEYIGDISSVKGTANLGI